MTAPNSVDEIKQYIKENIHEGHEFLAYLIQQWLAEARASAEPRLRPLSERPRIGDLVAARLGLNGHWRIERGAEGLTADDDGWVLLERAKPKTLAEEARELLTHQGDIFSSVNGGIESARWLAEAVTLLHRVADQEKHDA